MPNELRGKLVCLFKLEDTSLLQNMSISNKLQNRKILKYRDRFHNTSFSS